jgi:hypothetical protein
VTFEHLKARPRFLPKEETEPAGLAIVIQALNCFAFAKNAESAQVPQSPTDRDHSPSRTLFHR